MQVQSLGLKDSLEKEMATRPVFLPGESHRQRSLAGYSPWGHKELDKTEQLSVHAWTQFSTLTFFFFYKEYIIFICITKKEEKLFFELGSFYIIF